MKTLNLYPAVETFRALCPVVASLSVDLDEREKAKVKKMLEHHLISVDDEWTPLVYLLRSRDIRWKEWAIEVLDSRCTLDNVGPMASFLENKKSMAFLFSGVLNESMEEVTSEVLCKYDPEGVIDTLARIKIDGNEESKEQAEFIMLRLPDEHADRIGDRIDEIKEEREKKDS